MMKIGKHVSLRDAIRLLEDQGWRKKFMDGRHELWISPQGRSLTLAASGGGGRSAPAPHYLRSMLRQEARE